MLQQRHGRRARGRTTSPKRTALIEKIAGIMRAAEPTPFAAEGPCRAGIRESLCLDGWRWSRADDEAADIVAAALAEVGARRPTWQQGQPEYTQPGALPILRQHCINCAKPLPEGHYKFCCRPCAKAYASRRDLRHLDEELALKKKARAAVLRKERPTRYCQRCKDPFKPGDKGQLFCSRRCVTKSFICD